MPFDGRAFNHADVCKICKKDEKVQIAVAKSRDEGTQEASISLKTAIIQSHVIVKDFEDLMQKDKGTHCKYLRRRTAWIVKVR